MKPLRIVVVGCGHMGTSHAIAYKKNPGFEIVGIVSRGGAGRNALAAKLGGCPKFSDAESAISACRPDAVCIATYPETHAALSLLALGHGCHVFVEKPLATNMEDAEMVVAEATARGLAVVVGYILQHHPTWDLFVDRARQLGKPLVMRMNLNQQSSGPEWKTHENILSSLSPIADCGVHYVDVMCRMTGSRPVSVHAIGARLAGSLPAGRMNYGHLHVVFEDGSVGWYEAGWGPMMSETAGFVKDVIGPLGSASIEARRDAGSSDIDSHARTDAIRVHFSDLDAGGRLARKDEILDTASAPDHQGLCDLEQEYFLRAIRKSADTRQHIEAALSSLRIVLACEKSIREGRSVDLT